METLSLEELAVYTPSEISAESLSLFYNIIVGTPFDDLLNTTLFDDLVIALEGDDRIFGSFGNDIFVGGAGVDTADYSNLGQAITLEAGGFVNKGPLGGTDRLLEIESIVGAVGQANVIDGSTGTSSTTSLNVNLAKQSLIVNGVPGLGTLKFNVQNFVNVIGTEQGDIIIGDNNNNFLDGRGGNDTVFGLGGNDTVLGGAGNDVIGGGNQTKLSSSIFFYTDGNDIVDGGSGSDILIGGTGFDVLDGGTGFDTADYSHLGQAITLEAVGVVNKGFLGRDQILNMEKIIGAAGKANAIDGSTGTSTTTSLNVNLAQERLTVNGIPGLGSVTFQVENFANVTGTSQDDTIIGDNKNNVLEGGGGNDTVLGLGGNDSLIAGTGFDLLDGGTGFDTADYSNLGQAITLEAVGVVNKGFAGTDLISNIEKIIGAAGKANAIDGSTGTSTTTSLNVNLAQERLTVNGIPGLGSVTFQVENFANVTGTSQDDTIIGDNKNNVLEGGGGNDTVLGLGGNDSLIAGTGFDLLDGGTGFDTADYSNLGQAITLEAVGVVNKGFAGTDLISNIEKIIGAAGKANAIDGSTGTSTTTSLNVNLAQERLTVNGIPGLGSVTFQVQNFVNVTGTSQADSIVGNNKNNLLEGGKGNDSLSGLGGKDTLNGVDPTSVKPGLSEIDILTGGADADKFVVGDTKNPYYVGGGGFYGLNDFAFITDFETGQDKIQLNKSQNYLFGRNFIAVRNFLVPYPLPYEEASSDLLTTGGTLTTGEISEISMVDPGVDSVVNDIIGSGGTYDASTVGAESSLKSSSLIPFPSFDIIAIVADNYNYTDIHFV